MKDLFNIKSIKILSITLALVVIFSVAGADGNSVIASVFNSLTGGLSKVSAVGTNALSNKSYDELLEENQQLKQENADLRTQLVDYYRLRDENARLWKYYDIKKSNTDYEILPATVIRRDSNDDFYSFTADAGTADGVSVQDPVITENGLVGFVSSVNSSSCHITTILSPDIQAGAIDVKTNESGIVSGNTRYSDKNKTTLVNIDSSGNINEGDIIVTSGLGGVYPAGLIVGEVKSIEYDDYDTTKFAVIKPYEDIRTLTDVIILTDFETKGEISSGEKK